MLSRRMRFSSLVALCCFMLLTLGWSQQKGSSGSMESSQSGQSGQSSMSQGSMSQGQSGSSSAQNSSASSGQISPSQQHFLEHMAKGSQGEVELAKLAEQKASNPQVKQFAQKLQQDHTQLDQQMQSTISQLGMSMPQPLTQEQQKLQSRLQSLNGAQFDKAFVNAAVKEHQKDVSEVQQHMQSATNPQVKQLLQQALPVLQQHLQMAQQLQSQVGGQQGSSQQSSQQR